jgi:starch synthase
MRILFAASEVYPFSKTGGLADVAGALPEALAGLGHHVLVVTPWYRTLRADPAPLWVGDEWVPYDGGIAICGVGHLSRRGVDYAFVSHEMFQREQLYGFDDDAARFQLFSRAVPQAAAKLGFHPDVVHANDWHTGYVPMVLEHGWHLPEGFPKLPSVFTIHNVQYQGGSDLDAALYRLRLPGALRDSALNAHGRANAMQGALGFAHRVTTVSPTYAQEIQRPEYGYGLDGALRQVSYKLSGILNGIDTEVWNPATDPALPERYDAADPSGGKGAAKLALARRFGLDPARPLMGVVSRLADQKGIDILVAALPGLVAQGWAVFVLGDGDRELAGAIQHYGNHYRGAVGSYIGYDEGLAHLVYAAADTLAIPSRFEPCGLTQMIAMRYGALPVARATGGLVDTIRHDATGFLFAHATPEGLLWASGVARGAYNAKGHWRWMMEEAMHQDFSWGASAAAYLRLYQEMTGHHD